MTRHSILKKTFLYKHIYRPYRVKQEKAVADRKHTIFMQYGAQVLVHFAKSMQQAGLDYWLEFGTLLGAYRDGTFVPNELDLDVGAYLQDAPQIYKVLTQNGFRLVREFHVVGDNNMEQTYEYKGVTLDVFTLGKITFLNTEMSVPANTEEHLIEIFGSGYKVYDPNFKGDLNKIVYPWEEKTGIGFINY